MDLNSTLVKRSGVETEPVETFVPYSKPVVRGGLW